MKKGKYQASKGDIVKVYWENMIYICIVLDLYTECDKLTISLLTDFGDEITFYYEGIGIEKTRVGNKTKELLEKSYRLYYELNSDSTEKNEDLTSLQNASFKLTKAELWDSSYSEAKLIKEIITASDNDGEYIEKILDDTNPIDDKFTMGVAEWTRNEGSLHLKLHISKIYSNAEEFMGEIIYDDDTKEYKLIDEKLEYQMFKDYAPKLDIRAIEDWYIDVGYAFITDDKGENSVLKTMEVENLANPTPVEYYLEDSREYKTVQKKLVLSENLRLNILTLELKRKTNKITNYERILREYSRLISTLRRTTK